jgi:hypothetical protein
LGGANDDSTGLDEPQGLVGSVSLKRRLPLQSVELIEVPALHP